MGANNVGKTSVLEGLYLNLGAQNPSLSIRLNVLRGIEKFAASGEEIWGWLFNEKHIQQPIQLNIRDESGFEQRLMVRLGPAKEFELSVVQQPELVVQSSGSTSAPLSPTRGHEARPRYLVAPCPGRVGR